MLSLGTFNINLYQEQDLTLTASGSPANGVNWYTDTTNSGYNLNGNLVQATEYLKATFTNGTSAITTYGTWNGGSSFLVRFTPTLTGTWSLTTSSPNSGLNGQTATINVSSTAANHGFLRTVDSTSTSLGTFAYDDGTHFFYWGNTAYDLVDTVMTEGNTGNPSWQQAITNGLADGMNVVRVLAYDCGVSTSYEYSDYEPYVDTSTGHTSPTRNQLDFTTTGSAGLTYFQALDDIVTFCQSKGVEVELEAFTYYPAPSGSGAMRQFGTETQNQQFNNYLVGRYAAFDNVFFCAGNEYDYAAQLGETMQNLDNLAAILRYNDPWSTNGSGANRLVSSHDEHTVTFPWTSYSPSFATYIDLQWGGNDGLTSYGDQWGNDGTSGAISNNLNNDFLNSQNTPVVDDEYGYTDANSYCTPADLRNAIWGIAAAGGYGSAGSSQNSTNPGCFTGNWSTDSDDVTADGDISRMTSFFTNNFQYWLMSSANSLVTSGSRVYALAQTGQQYVFYSATTSGFTATVGTSGENFSIYRYDPTTGNTTTIGTDMAGGSLNFTAGSLSNDYVIYAKRVTSGSLPSGWSDTDVNGSTPAGSASYSSGVYTITGGGTGYHSSGTSDQFNYCSESWAGSGTMIAEVTSLGPTTPNAANSAVMFRNDTTAGSMYAALGMDTSGGMAFKTRTSTGGATVQQTLAGPGYGPSSSQPIWLELVDNGNSFAAFYGTGTSQPTSWTQVGTATTVSLNGTALAGMGVTEWSNSATGTATFQNVSVAATAPAAPSNLAANVVSSSQINLTWTNNANNQTGFHLDQATNSTFTSGLVTYTTTSTSYNDTGLSAGTTYYFRVRAYNGAGDSGDSNTVSGTTTTGGLSLTDVDINGSTPAGSASYNSSTGVYTVTGGGTGYHASQTSDQFNFDYESTSGNNTMIAEVTSLGPTTPNEANCAVMFRNDTTAGSMYAALGVDTGGGMAFKTRTSASGSTGQQGATGPGYGPSSSNPIWLKLVDSGSSFTAFYGTGTSQPSSWTQVGTATTVSLNSSYLVGLGVTEWSTTATGTATFQNLSAQFLDRAPIVNSTAPSLKMKQLVRVEGQAVAAWEAVGLTAAQISALSQVQLVITNLPGSQLGETISEEVMIDTNAAGYGWSIGREVAPNQVDLLTVVEHELGHVLGLADISSPSYPSDLMDEMIPLGVRRSISAHDVALLKALADPDATDYLFG